MSADARKPTYDQLSALCAQMVEALEAIIDRSKNGELGTSKVLDMRAFAATALTAYRTLSPDPVWQRVPEGCVVVPEKLTEEMLYAGLRYLNSLRDCPHPGMQPNVPNFWASIIERARGEG